MPKYGPEVRGYPGMYPLPFAPTAAVHTRRSVGHRLNVAAPSARTRIVPSGLAAIVVGPQLAQTMRGLQRKRQLFRRIVPVQETRHRLIL
jgi:hypothetical protein